MAKSDVRSKYPDAYVYQWARDSWCVYASRNGPLAGINLGHGRTAAEAWADATRKLTPATDAATAVEQDTTEAKVERFDPFVRQIGVGDIEPGMMVDAEGDYVRYTDYAALQAEVARHKEYAADAAAAKLEAELAQRRTEAEAALAEARRDAERLMWASRAWGGWVPDFTSYVLRVGGNGDLGDVRAYIDAALHQRKENEHGA